MSTLPTELTIPNIVDVAVSRDTLSVELSDGRILSAPLEWYPRLAHASLEERNIWRLIGTGQGIHWKDINEDISVENLLFGKPSSESKTSFEKWLAEYQSRKS